MEKLAISVVKEPLIMKVRIAQTIIPSMRTLKRLLIAIGITEIIPRQWSSWVFNLLPVLQACLQLLWPLDLLLIPLMLFGGLSLNYNGTIPVYLNWIKYIFLVYVQQRGLG